MNVYIINYVQSTHSCSQERRNMKQIHITLQDELFNIFEELKKENQAKTTNDLIDKLIRYSLRKKYGIIDIEEWPFYEKTKSIAPVFNIGSKSNYNSVKEEISELISDNKMRRATRIYKEQSKATQNRLSKEGIWLKTEESKEK
jgi:hypothetical protein